MKSLVRWAPVALVVALGMACQVDRLIRPPGGTDPPPDSTPATPGPPHVAFGTQPTDATVGQALTPPVSVVIVDSTGDRVTSYTGSVSLALSANASGATLSGNTATASAGVATFPGLSVSRPGSGYTLAASAAGMPAATSAAFDVDSAPPPPPSTGSLTVTASTGGADLDSDGYTVTVSGTGSQAVGINGSTTFSGIAAGSHTVALGGLASNCSAGGGNSQTVSVPAGGSAGAAFAVTCQTIQPPPTNHPPVVSAGGNQSALEAVLYQLNASFSDSDGDGPWTYQINWGDGTSDSGTLTAQGAIGPSHTYVLPGNYQITVTVTDSHGASASDSKTLTVTV